MFEQSKVIENTAKDERKDIKRRISEAPVTVISEILFRIPRSNFIPQINKRLLDDQHFK